MVYNNKVLKLLRQLRGGVNQLSLCLNNFNSIKPFLIFLQVIINIIQHIDNINNEHQSHIRYTQKHIFTRKPIKGENLFFFEMIGSLLSSVHHLCLSTNSKCGYYLCFTSSNLLREPTLQFLQHRLEGSTNSLSVLEPTGWKHLLPLIQAPTCLRAPTL